MADVPIYTYGDLKAALIQEANREDIADKVADFIHQAHIRIEEVVDTLERLQDDGDTNAMLAYDPYIYLNGAMVAAARYLRDGDMMSFYQPEYDRRLRKLRLAPGFDKVFMAPNGPVA